jgi:hypothetical protein
VIEGEVTIPKAYEAFTADDRLVDASKLAAVKELVERLVEKLS